MSRAEDRPGGPAARRARLGYWLGRGQVRLIGTMWALFGGRLQLDSSVSIDRILTATVSSLFSSPLFFKKKKKKKQVQFHRIECTGRAPSDTVVLDLVS